MKLVIFDCDGTLVDSQHMICAAMHNTFARHSLPAPPRETLLSVVGLSLQECFERLGAGRPGFPVASLVEGYKSAFGELRLSGSHVEPLYPGAGPAVEALGARPDIRLGMATGKSQKGARGVLERNGWLDRFVTIQTADDAPSKPHPGMVLAAMREAGVGPADTCVVGDTSYDVAMALAAGATPIGVSWGYHPPARLREAGAQIVIEDFSALIPELERIWLLPSPLVGEGGSPARSGGEPGEGFQAFGKLIRQG